MSAARREALALIVRALVWLVPCFAAWYAGAVVVAWLPAKIAAPVLAQVAGGGATAHVTRRLAVYDVTLEGKYRPGGAERAEASVEVPAATYTFGIALFAALALASRGWRTPGRLALGLALLLPLPAFGITFDALRQLGGAPQLAALLGWGQGAREAIALGYQVGSLLLPTLAPVIAWLALFPAAWKPAPPAA